MDEKIHIIALGDTHVEMVISPLELFRPDSVYILIPPIASPDQSQAFQTTAEKITAYLRTQRDLQWVKVDFSDLKAILLTTAWIFGQEKQRKNKIFVNLAIGGPKVAVGLTISCCLFQGEPYYITTDPTTQTVTYPYVVEWLALRPYDLPTMNQIRMLDLLQQGNSRRSDLIRLASAFDGDFAMSRKEGPYPLSRHFNLLSQRYLLPLIAQGYINITEQNQIQLSAMGDLYGTALVAYLKAMDRPDDQ